MEARSSLTQDCSRIFLGRRDFGLLVAGFTRAEGSAVDGSVLETSGLGSGRCSGFVSGPGVILAGGADAADEEGPSLSCPRSPIDAGLNVAVQLWVAPFVDGEECSLHRPFRASWLRCGRFRWLLPRQCPR